MGINPAQTLSSRARSLVRIHSPAISIIIFICYIIKSNTPFWCHCVQTMPVCTSANSIEIMLALSGTIGEIVCRFSCYRAKRWMHIPHYADLIPDKKQVLISEV